MWDGNILSCILFINLLWEISHIKFCSSETWFSLIVLLPKYFLYFQYLIEAPFRNRLGCLFPSMTAFLYRGSWKISIGLPQNVDFNIPISLSDSLEKTLMLENIKSRRRRGWHRMKMVWMVSPSQWTRVWANSGRWWRIGPGVLQSLWLQRVGHDLAAKQ